MAELVQRSNVLTAQVLAHLVELEQRLLHLELGFSSLFAYCVEALGMSEGTAGRRVAAARVCRRFPEVFERVARGELHLCALCALSSHLSNENAVELFEACKGKTRRKIEELLAVRFPRPDVREQIRRLPARAEVPVGPVEQTLTLTRANDEPTWTPMAMTPTMAMIPLVPEMPRVAANATLRPVGSAGADARGRARELERLSADRFGVHFTADAELRDLIERARALASHRIPKGDPASLMKLMVASFVRQEEKRRFGIGVTRQRSRTKAMPEKLASVTEQQTPPGGAPLSEGITEPTTGEASAGSVGKRGRYVPVTVRREIYGRDRGQCAFVSADGRRCNARTFLELDHVKPYARLGTADAPNIRVLCQAHNLLHARNCFGALHVAAKIAAKKRRDPAAKSQ